MLNGIRIVESIIEKPLESLVGLILACVIALGVFAVNADKAHAKIRIENSISNEYHAKQDSMFEMLIRIDENVKLLKH
jgi:hypothetical protein